MKTLTYILTILFFTQIAKGQEPRKEIEIPIALLESKSLYYEKMELSKQIGLIDLKNSNDSLIIRFWDSDKVVELIKNDSIMIFVYPIVYTNHNILTTNKITISDLDKNNLLIQLYKQKITSLPDYSEINGYKLYKTGFTYCFEIATKTNYRFYSYYKPQNQENIDYAIMVSKIIEIINKEVKSRVILNDFLNGLEYGVYKYKAVIVSGAEHSYIPCDVQFNHIFMDE